MSHSIRDLRRMWKPHKERLNALVTEGHPTCIRFHRACSWLGRGASALESNDLDVALVSQWVAFNALYGQWDAVKCEPKPDASTWRDYLHRILKLDGEQHLGRMLRDHRPLIMTVFRNQFLSRNFWQNPCENGTQGANKASRDAANWYADERWFPLLKSLFDRIYFLRCQLVHGAATYESDLNREALKYCSMTLDHFVRGFLYVLIHHGADEDWGSMCYPPIHNKTRRASSASEHGPLHRLT
jgi:hypothetical protein